MRARMYSFQLTRIAATFYITLAQFAVSYAQTTPNIDLEQGLKPFAAYNRDRFDVIGLANGNLNVRIPLFSLPQRGGVGLSFSLRLRSGKNWDMARVNIGPTPVLSFVWDGQGVVVVRDQ